MDNRRRQWIPVSSHVAFSHTGTKLLEKWGPEGLLTWILYLAACKREVNQGEFTYSSEAEGWMKLGAQASEFTLDEFFAYTGRLRKTSLHHLGRITSVSCRNWEDWRVRSPSTETTSKQEENTNTNGAESNKKRLRDSDSDRITITETEKEKDLAIAKRVFEHWKNARGKKQARLTQGRVRKIRSRLKTFSESDLIRAIDAVALDPWEDRVRYDDIGEHVCRSDEQVEKWLELANTPLVLSPEERRQRHLESLKERGVA